MISNIKAFQFSFFIACCLQLIFSVSAIAGEKTYFLASKDQPLTGHGPTGNSTAPPVDDKTIKDCTVAIKCQPKNAYAYGERAREFAFKGQLQKAIDDYSQAIKLQPKNFFFYECRGGMYVRQGLGEKAIADYDQAVKLTPNNYARYSHRASAYHDLGQDQKAMEDCNKAIRLEQGQPYLYTFRAMLYLCLKNFDKALVDYDKAISLIPHNQCKYEYAHLYVDRALLYREMKNYPKALADCDKAIGCEPYITSMFLNGKAPKCLKAVHQVEGICSAYSVRGTIRFEQGQFERALEDLNSAIKLDPKCARCYAIRERIYFKLGLKKKQTRTLTALEH